MPKIDPRIAQALNETGLPFTISHGHGHLKLFLCSRLAGVVTVNSHRKDNQRACKNVVSQIRRLGRELSEGK